MSTTSLAMPASPPTNATQPRAARGTAMRRFAPRRSHAHRRSPPVCGSIARRVAPRRFNATASAHPADPTKTAASHPDDPTKTASPHLADPTKTVDPHPDAQQRLLIPITMRRHGLNA
jgi:hypothetical protein